MTTTTRRPQKTFSAILQWHSLKTRVTLFTLVIFLISIWSLALYVSYILQKNMGQALGEQQFSTVSIIASDINDELSERLKILEIIAAKITPSILGNASSTQKLLESHISIMRSFNFGATVIRLDGIVIADVPISAGRIGVNYSDRDWVIELLKNKKSLVGKPALGKKSNAPVFVMAAPIQDVNGKIIGAILGVTDLSKPSFLSKITDNSYGKTGGYLLVAPKIRTIVYATDKKRIMEVLPPPGINPLIDSYLQGYEGSGTTVRPNDGVAVLSSAKGIPVVGWYIVALMPTKEAFAPVHAMMWSFLLATIFLTLLAGGLIWWMLKRQLEPVFTTIKTLATLSNTDQTPHHLPITQQDEIGELIGGFNHLLSTLAQREEALRESETHYRSLVEGMPCIVYAFSRKRGGVYYSSNVTNLLGYSPEQLYAQPLLWHNSIHPDDLSCIEKVIRETETGKPFCVEYRILDTHGNWHWFDDRSFGYKMEGADTIIEGFAFDITDRKQAESERKNMEKQLLQSQKMEAIGTLAGGVAHDFNNILSVIIGYTELAMDRNQKENQMQYLQETLEGAERAKNLVKQILTFSRLDDHEKKPLDIKHLLKEAVKFLRSSIPTTIEINQQITAEECNIMADPTQMHQVIMNLCTNAAHAMKQTGGILKLELNNIELAKDEIPNHHELQPGHYAKLTVSDTGYGIDPAIIQSIFDPFFTTKSVDEGTGLGLSVVYGIIKSHGGVINVYSEPGKGANFNVYLPRIIHSEAIKVDMDKPVIGGTERILFVDDEPALVKMAIRTLFLLGYQASGADGSMEALDLFRAEPQSFDLVITDMTLPKMTGIDLSREILKIRPDIPIILCSGIKEPGTEAEVKSLGIKAYLTKPLTRRELSLAIREVLEKRAEGKG